jgi:SPOR domain
MADRYSNRPFPADDYNRGSDQHGSGGAESDPLAELARLIGQTDPFGSTGRQTPPPPPQRAALPRQPYQPPPPPQQYQAPIEEEDEPSAPAARPQWMQRANVQRQVTPPPVEYPEQDDQHYSSQDYSNQDYSNQDYPSSVHPLHRYAAQPGTHHDDYDAQAYDQEGQEQQDPSRYDDALYGQLESAAQDFQREPAYPDDPYAYQDGYEDEPEEAPKRRGGLLTVAAVLALAVVGTGAAFAYRTYIGPTRSGDPPIIRADNTPTKIIPTSTDSGKTSDRMPAGDGTEKLVPREETPVDVNAKAAGPRVVFPPLNANNNPPPPASVATNAMPSAAPTTNGTMPSSEPRKVRTLTVRGDEADASAAPPAAAAPPPAQAPAAKQAAATRQVQPAPAMRTPSAPAGNAPLSLSPDSAQASVPPTPAEPRTRMASTTPTQTAPAEQAPAGEGRFLVSVTSQPTEAEAQSSYRAMQRKYPDQLGSRTPIIKKVDKKGGGSAYRALVGPFASREEATRFCSGYSSAGGQCWVP